MYQAASPFIQEQKFLDAFQQAIETHSFDRMIISQYKGELEHLEKMTLRAYPEYFLCKSSLKKAKLMN